MRNLLFPLICFSLTLPLERVLAGDAANLAERLKQGDGRAAEALVKQGKAAVPALVGVLKDGNPQGKTHAALALGRIGPDAKEAIEPLIEALTGPDLTLSSQAALALGRIGPDAAPALIKTLETA